MEGLAVVPSSFRLENRSGAYLVRFRRTRRSSLLRPVVIDDFRFGKTSQRGLSSSKSFEIDSSPPGIT
jgi:hypothetical protein